MTEWIYIPNWHKFQHYKDRHPVWIKVYLELREHPAWMPLSMADRGLLVSFWVEFAARGPISVASLRQTFGRKVSQNALDRLNQAEFIAYAASRPLALREEKIREEQTLLADLQPDNPNGEVPRDPEAIKRIKALAERIGH